LNAPSVARGIAGTKKPRQENLSGLDFGHKKTEELFKHTSASFANLAHFA
jgi:hypothetical protein